MTRIAPYFVIKTTNLFALITSWTSVVTNTFGVGGGFDFTYTIYPGQSAKFFLGGLP
jgi:hypothetical protein